MCWRTRIHPCNLSTALNLVSHADQSLVQGILANDHNPTLDSHSAFVVRMDRTVLRLTGAFIPRAYPSGISPLTQRYMISKNLIGDERL
jgi:hypothetical protein